MSEYTPGPWQYLRDFGQVATDEPCAYQVLLVLSEHADIPETEYHANGNLIAAAPELLESVMELVRVGRVAGVQEWGKARAAAFAAIAKAEGRKP